VEPCRTKYIEGQHDREENKNLQAGASHPVFFFFCGNILREKIFRYPQRNVLQYIKTTPQNYQAAVKPCGLK